MLTIQPFLQQTIYDSSLLATESVRDADKRGNTHTISQGTTGTHSSRVEISPPSRLQSDRDTAIEAGNYARRVDDALIKAGSLANEMKEKLFAITKQFPPFAANSDERFQYLNSFSGLRAQFESLTFPSDPEVGGGWVDLIIPAKQYGWDMPTLDPSKATDDEVRKAEAEIEKVNGDIDQQRQNLRNLVSSALGGHERVEEARLLSKITGQSISD